MRTEDARIIAISHAVVDLFGCFEQILRSNADWTVLLDYQPDRT